MAKFQGASVKMRRSTFSKIPPVAKIPNLIEVQKKSFEILLQDKIDPSQRQVIGFEEVLRSVFPVEVANGTLEYVSYNLCESKYDVEEAKNRSSSYSALLKLVLRLILWDTDEDTGAKEIKNIKEQEVYVGEVPLMTENGTFIFNGTERVIVSQVHKSPGVFFDHDGGKVHISGKYFHFARCIPNRGSWLEFEFDAKDLLFFRVDRKRKLHITTLLRALNMDSKSILNSFYKKIEYKKISNKWSTEFSFEKFRGVKVIKSIVNSENNEVVVESGTKITPRIGKKLIEDGLKSYYVDEEDMVGLFLAEDILDKSGNILYEAGYELTLDSIEQINELKLKSLNVLNIDNIKVGPYIRNTLFADKNLSKEDALVDIFRVMRPGEPATVEAAEQMFNNLFFNPERYDLSVVGRVKMNARLDLNIDESVRVLTHQDIIGMIDLLVKLKDGDGYIDDIDHLGNRRIRSVGELIENQFRIGMVRMVRAVSERMASLDLETVMPSDLVNSKILGTVMREFFGTSQLSQFMDQTNPLSEITHKRRLSALGPGGLSRDRATFEARDVHPTHYGRICPIETPEGQNIGLISSLATFGRVNNHGFIESPYRRVIDKKVTNEVVYLSAIEEGKYTIAQANARLNEDNFFVDNLISCRKNGDFIMSSQDKIDFIDVAPMQLVSVAASLIPFLENDDANRALMGSNMQRQAVPLIKSDAPYVGTGIEGLVAQDSGAVVVAKRSGFINQVDSTRIVIRADSDDLSTPGVDIYALKKYQRSNFNTCINQTPLVKVGEYVNAGDVIADGPSTENGELALGRNVLVAFMPWNGYNYEDSILISERIAKEDIFTSIHIEEFEVVARDTRLGPEEITRDIPNMNEEYLRNLDEAGIVYVGAEVKPGDVLVGKVTPKSESPMTSEEKLLRAIFGEKAADVRDSSLHVPPGISGTVIGVRVLSRRGVEKDPRAEAIERMEIERISKDRDDELKIIENYTFSKLREILLGNVVVSGPKNIESGSIITQEILSSVSDTSLWQFVVESEDIMNSMDYLKGHLNQISDSLNKKFISKVNKLQSGDDLPQGALKVVKVFIAMKHKLQPGDKMAGRHGNKGVISRIVPIEDMPYMEDGTHVDMVLNPLGVPSRMNIGQILETHLGWASAGLGKKISKEIEDIHNKKEKVDSLRDLLVKVYEGQNEVLKVLNSYDDEQILEYAEKIKKGVYFSTPVFDGAKEADINRMLDLAGFDTSGQITLYDGRTGDAFDRRVTVGYIYMLKLHHLVDDKIHARSIGPYSLVTQQPLGGKSHFGGQRFGEMECWALQAYGAAYTLQEMLTVKSDDVTGRIKIYESIIRGDQNFECSIPESFHVMIKELRSLCLNIEMLNDDHANKEAV